MTNKPFAPLGNPDRTSREIDRKTQWDPILPVPKGAVHPPKKHYELGSPSSVWKYLDAEGRLIGLVYRFDPTENDKEFRPLTFCRNAKTEAEEWRWQSWDEPRPLYGLYKLAAKPDAPVIVCEGEKSADAAERLLPSFVTVTSSGGSKAARNADWKPLADRDVVIWPDADEPGARYARDASSMTQAVGATSVKVMSPPSSTLQGWDAANALEEEWTTERVLALVRTASLVSRSASDGIADNSDDEDVETQPKKRVPQRDTLLTLLEDCEFWHDRESEAYASFSVDNHVENARIKSKKFRIFVAGHFYKKTGSAVGCQALQDALNVIESMAIHEGKRYNTFRRVGQLDGNIYVDLGDDDWRAVRVHKDGWEAVRWPPVKFLRTGAMEPIPMPESGEGIERARAYMNVGSDDDFRLIIGWALGALRAVGPYPILVVSGEQGSGKSQLTELLSDLVDPEIGKKRTAPKDERDLIVAANNGHLLLYDNLSSIAPWFADALCRISTGGGFAARQLHTDAEQIVIAAQRPVCLNGIPDLAKRADLADRVIAVHLPAFAKGERLTESELKSRFEVDKPHIMGALLTGLSAGLRNWDKTNLVDPPRMADFARWVEACASGMGWESGEFLEAYERNRKDAATIAFEADIVAVSVKSFMDEKHPGEKWQGRPTDLYDALCAHVSEKVKMQRAWPKSAAVLGQVMRRVAPLLRDRGYDFEASKSGERFMTIKLI